MSTFLAYTRYGRFKQPIYRISIKKAKGKRNGKVIKNIGTYLPLPNNKKILINWDHFNSWLIKNINLKKKKKPLKNIIELAIQHERDSK